MSDKSNKYGYVGVDIPAQSFGANKGVFNPAEINELVADNKWTSFGQLELIETQTVTSATTNIDFIDIKEDIYDVHYLTVNNAEFQTNNSHIITRLSNDNGSTFESGNNYQLVGTNNGSDFNLFPATFMMYHSVSMGNLTGDNANGYINFHNLGNSTKWSVCNSMFTQWDSQYYYLFGSGLYYQTETMNAIRLTTHNTTTWTGSFSLYGIRYS